MAAINRHVDLAADDGLNASVLAGLVMIDDAEEVAVICESQGGHTLLGRQLGHPANPTSSVEQAVFAVTV